VIVLFCCGAVSASPSDSDWRPSVHESVGNLFVSQEPLEPNSPAPALAFQIPQGPEPHPTPPSTGFRSLLKDTGKDFIAFPKRRSTWVILGIGAGGAALSHPADATLNAQLAGEKAGHFFALGKYLGAPYTQIAVALGLYAVGRLVVPEVEGEPRTNRWSHLGFDLLRAQMVTQALVQGMKVSIQRDRPTGECCAFPSGHAASTFAAASVIERHFGYRLAWPTVLIATYVGMSRLHDNRHYLSDVVFGAALGTATGWTVVGRHGRESYALLPTPVRGGVAVFLTRGGGINSGF
jgi:membrane-associated phospholipid phosphatase